MDENDRLQLWVNFDDGNLQVVNRENGYVWRSAPTAEEMSLEKSNALWSNNLRSPIMFTYVQEASAANRGGRGHGLPDGKGRTGVF